MWGLMVERHLSLLCLQLREFVHQSLNGFRGLSVHPARDQVEKILLHCVGLLSIVGYIVRYSRHVLSQLRDCRRGYLLPCEQRSKGATNQSMLPNDVHQVAQFPLGISRQT